MDKRKILFFIVIAFVIGLGFVLLRPKEPKDAPMVTTEPMITVKPMATVEPMEPTVFNEPTIEPASPETPEVEVQKSSEPFANVPDEDNSNQYIAPYENIDEEYIQYLKDHHGDEWYKYLPDYVPTEEDIKQMETEDAQMDDIP